jgi:two-component system chemotaxis response regulator CheB
MRPAVPSAADDPAADGLRPRVLVIDDSATSRALVADLLEEGGCTVVGRAMDGALGLRLLAETSPDVVVCDIDMPRMDGFTFLRIVQKTTQTPTIVLTSFGSAELALFSLDHGARDFVVKATRPEDVPAMGQQLLARIRVLVAAARLARPPRPAPVEVVLPEHIELVALGASTGGPPALRQILSRWTAPPRVPVVIAQHMPARFTAAFAARLRSQSSLDVDEATDGAPLSPGMVRIAPGGHHCRIERGADGVLRTRVVPATTDDRWVPGVDELLGSAASVCGAGVLGVVLTGMGRDGGDGARALATAGAPLWIESPQTAVVDGMPQAASRSHPAAVALPLEDLVDALSLLLVRPPTGDADSGRPS